MNIAVALDRDNVENLRIRYGGEPFDFAAFGVTKVEVAAGDAIMSSVDGDINYAGDMLNIKFGKMEGLTAGIREASIVLFTAGSPDGIEIIGPKRPDTLLLYIS